MAIGEMLMLLRPIALIILLALHRSQALVLHSQPSSSFNTHQVVARAEQAVTLEPYTGNGAAPLVQSWRLLSTDLPIQYTPTESNITLRITLKDNNAQIVTTSTVYNLTVLGLAGIASSVAATNGNRDFFPRSSQGNSTFATSATPWNLKFMMTASDYLPVYAVTSVLRAMQELTHYLYFLEMAFEVFNDTSSTNSPIASGCLAYSCGSQTEGSIETVQTRNLEIANSSATNFTSAPSRQLQSSIAPIQLTNFDELEAIAVTYDELENPLPVYDQSFADVATRMLANITNLIIADQSDALLPLKGRGSQRILRYVDTWGSNLAISLLPMNLLGFNFTLGQAAMALKITQDNLNNGPLVESRLQIMLDGSTVGWGCLSYANASAWRCLMPTPGSSSSVGSQSISGAANAVSDPNTST